VQISRFFANFSDFIPWKTLRGIKQTAMKKIFFFPVLLFIFSTQHLSAQKGKMTVVNGDTMYIIPPSEGDKLYEKGDVKGAVAAYEKQLKKSPADSADVAYNYACMLTKSGRQDEAFKYLWIDLRHDTNALALSDPDFIPLWRNDKWPAFYESTIKGIKKKYSKLVKDFPLAEKLWEMQARDQAYYYEIEIAEKKMGMNCPVALALWQAKEDLNNENVRELDSIIKVKGWPKVSEVGHLAAGSAFLIVQHSNLELQQKYLPVIKKLCEEKEADWQSYALMYDRVQVFQDKPQLYGSQLHYDTATKKSVFYPIEDEKNVDKRRAEMGMEPLEQYAAQFGIKYVPVK
jgi:tetratricopeptide (TPR) repeat protein